MRTKNFLKHLTLGAVLLTSSNVVGQTTTAFNVASSTNDFLGWDNTFPANNFPLMVRHDLNQPIEWYTNALQRMRLNQALTLQSVNNYGNLTLTGFLGVGNFMTSTNVYRHPAARVHAEHDATTEAGFRPMIGDGFTNATSLENDRLTIVPYPFQERTTLSYLLEAPARVRLQVHTESGMHLATLRDQPQEPGSYSMTWDTQDLAPGLYYVTLFADGKPVVKKAVKVR